MGIIFIAILSSALFFLLIPRIFKLVLQQFLGFSTAIIKFKHPFKIIRTHLQISKPFWGIKNLIIFISEIQIKVKFRKLKICVVLKKPRIMLMRNNNQLLPLKVVDGLKQSNLLHNLVTIIKTIELNKKDFSKKTKSNVRVGKAESGFKVAYKALLQLIIMIIVQLIELHVVNGDVGVIDSIPDEQYTKKSDRKDIQAKITFLQTFSQYLLFIDFLKINANFHEDQQINIVLDCPHLKLFTAEHLQDALIKSEDLSISLRIPFTFSLRKSISRISIFFIADKLTSHCTPNDLLNLSKFIKQMMFDKEVIFSQNQKEEKQEESEQNEQKSRKKKIIFCINEGKIKLFDLCQQDQDTAQSKKYLSNICYATLILNDVKISDGGFAVQQVNLGVKKYDKLQENQSEWPQEIQNIYQKDKPYLKQIFKINNLLITKSEKLTHISHDDVKLSCQREELALLGKLFNLINERMIFDEYKELLYAPFLSIAEQYIKQQKSLVQVLKDIIRIKKTSNPYDQAKQQQSNPSQHESLLTYNPKIIEIQLDISELIHKIILYSSQYRQSRSIAGQIDHQLNFKRITMQYKITKEFQVTDFKLFYKQTEMVNELELQVGDIIMTQNFQTLKDYFIGFTMFKLLLQFSSEQEQTRLTSTKMRKKSLNFGKIILYYATEMLTLRKLSVSKQTNPDGKLSSLYFSLAKCDLSVQRLFQTKKIMKYHINNSHNLVTISSITIKEFLTSNNSVGRNFKHKYMINIKNPSLLLPEVDISERIVNYVKTLHNLETSMEAFLNNTTEDKVRTQRRRYKVFMVDPDLFTIKITNLLIGIEDSVFDRSLLNRMRFDRQYLQKKHKYHEGQVIKALRQNYSKLNLFQIQIENISIDIKPIVGAGQNEISVNQWINNLKKTKEKVEPRKQVQKPRLIRVNNLSCQLQVGSFKVKIRDYPYDIVRLSKIGAKFEYLRTKNIYEETFNYFKGFTKIDQLSIRVGLNLLSGMCEIYKKVSRYTKSLDEYRNTYQFLQAIKSKSNLELPNYKPYWHVMHKSSYWQIQLQKEQQIYMELMTGLTPYCKESLKVKLGPLSFSSNPELTTFSIMHFQLSGNQLKIVEVGKQIFKFKTIYQQPFLNLMVNFNIFSHNSFENHRYRDNRIRISSQIIQQIWKIKQLRLDWLLLYGLIQPWSKRHEDILQRQQQIDYISLFKMAAELKLKNKQRQLTIFSVLKQVKFFFNIDKISLQIADENNQVDFLTKSFHLLLTLEEKEQKWKRKHFLCTAQHIIGRLKVYKRIPVINYESNYRYIEDFEEVTNTQISNFDQTKDKEKFREVFFVARNMKVKLGQYSIYNNEVLYLLRKIQIDSVKLQLAAELKKVLDQLFNSLVEANKKKVEDFTKNHYYMVSPRQKLRQTVAYIIRNNRKKRNFCPKVKAFIALKSFEMGFKTKKQLMVLTNGKPPSFIYNTTYHQEDHYHCDPKISLKFNFQDVELWISNKPNNLWILGKGYTPNLLSQNQKVLKCRGVQLCFQNHENEKLHPHYIQFLSKSSIERYRFLLLKFSEGQVVLTRSNIDILKEISDILLNLVKTKQSRRKQWFAEKEKYSQMIQNGRQSIKTKLSWKFSDVTKGEKPVIQSQLSCILDKVNITIFGEKKTAVKRESKESVSEKSQGCLDGKKEKYAIFALISSNIQIKVSLFTLQNISKEFHVNNLTIINCLQPKQSSYRTVFETSQQDNLSILVKMQQCLLSATNQNIHWNFFKSVYFRFFPVKFKLTQQFYNEIYYFFFGIDPQTNESEEELSNILPNYYLTIVIEEVKVQAWYRTSSRLKRLEGVSIGIQRFGLSNEFLDRKTLFDRWVKFLLKQLASQFLNVLGQKIFG